MVVAISFFLRDLVTVLHVCVQHICERVQVVLEPISYRLDALDRSSELPQLGVFSLLDRLICLLSLLNDSIIARHESLHRRVGGERGCGGRLLRRLRDMQPIDRVRQLAVKVPKRPLLLTLVKSEHEVRLPMLLVVQIVVALPLLVFVLDVTALGCHLLQVGEERRGVRMLRCRRCGTHAIKKLLRARLLQPLHSHLLHGRL